MKDVFYILIIVTIVAIIMLGIDTITKQNKNYED